jgi:glycosyltransferase involved in cell wall biosynthesis
MFIRRTLRIRLGRFHQYSPRPLSVSNIKSTPVDDSPKIMLVTPSFNQGAFVEATIKSVLAQNYPRLQYVVQDACSTDSTEEVLKFFQGTDVEILIESDNGQADALNRGFARTPADVMGYLNSDDLLLPGTLRFVAQYFFDNPSVDVIYGNRLIIDESGHEIGRWILPGHDMQVLRFVDYVPQETMFWRRRIWERVGAKFDTSLQFAMDWDLILRFLDAGAVFHHVPKLFGVFRAHGAQKSQRNFVTRGTKEMANLRFRHEDINLSRLQRTLLHAQYLYRHVKADAAWQAEHFF